MGRKSLISITLLLIATLRIAAQSGPSTFEFVENKGQWDKRVVFKGELPAGEFYLLKNGFTVVQHNTNDLMRLFNRHHNEGGPATATHPTKTGNVGPKTPYPDTDTDPGNQPFTIHSHAYQVQFVGANENAQVIPDRVIPSFNNYFIGNDPSKWATDVKIFQAVVYKNIYPNIDVRYYSESGRLKYDLIVNPGGEVNNVVMQYAGADKLSIKNNELIIKTSVGDVKELYPYAYQFDKTSGKQEVKCNFELVDKDKVRFSIKNYSKTSTLVIDPILIFSSFTGSRAGNWGYTATPGPDGSLFSGSIVFDAGNGFPASPGAYQGSSAGGRIDIGILKFSPTGTQRLYATYLGGNANEHPHSIISDNQGNLVIMGRTNSSDYPGTRIGKGGSDDIIVTKLNANGSKIIGSLIIGGTGADGINVEDQFEGGTGAKSGLRFYGDDSRSEVILDNAGNIYVAAQTQSVSTAVADRFPTSAGAFQPNPGATSGNTLQDGVVIKINPTCTDTVWSSFLGGSGDDGAFVLALNQATNDIYVAGFTNSNNFPGIAGGVYQTSYQGGPSDGFVSIISNDGTTLRRSTYAGTGSFDAIYGIQFDNNSIPYIMGVSEGIWPVQNARYSNANSKQFISKLRTDLSGFQYSTVFGSGSSRPNISPVAFLVDRCENVYISGWGGLKSGTDYQTSGTAGMPVTRDALKSITDNEDFYFIVIKKDADTILYGTYFGQDGGYEEHVDGGTSRYDKQGVIYQAICANCFGGSQVPITKPFPITPGVWGPVNGTGTANCNLAAVKIAFNFSGVASGPKALINGVQDTSGCVPLTIVLRDTIRTAKRYQWNFGDGSPEVFTTAFEQTHTYMAIGDYRVRLIAIDSTTCNIRDTAYLTIRVRDDKADISFTKQKTGNCQDLSYLFTNTSVAPPGKPFKPDSFIWDFGDGTRVSPATSPITHSFATPGTYIVRLVLVDTSYCNAPDSIPVTLRVSPLVSARFEVPDGCAPYEALFDNTSLAGEQFFWDFGDGSTSTDVNPTHTYPGIGQYTVKLIAIDTNTCNKIDSITHIIKVNPKPTAEFSVTPVPPQINQPAIFANLSTGGNRYEWYFGDGDSSVRRTTDPITHQYNATGTYMACLVTFNEFECFDSICHPVEALINPLLDVPNAFTPGRFGRNSTVRVEGFGIAKMTWKIYNRWGQVVFEARNNKVGWDGTYKGQPQPMDVYAYTLDVEFSDGTKTRKSGDITLIR